MASSSLTDYYNSHVNFDKLNPLIRSAYNTTFDFDEYKQKILAKVDYGNRDNDSSLLDSMEEIRREQRVRLAQVEHDYYKQKKAPIFDVPFYPEEDEEQQKRETIVTSKPPKPTASRRSPSPALVTEEHSEHHIHHRPVSATIVQRHDVDDDFAFYPRRISLNSTTSSLHDFSSSHVENHIQNMWNEYELEDYMEKRK